MTPGARVQAAIELLDEIRAGAAAEQAITGWARRSRFAGSKDRAAVRDHVFQALRAMRSYACLGGADTGRGIMLGALRDAGQDISAIFSGQGHAPEPLTAAEQLAGHPPREIGDRMDLPDWIIPLFSKSLGGENQAVYVAKALRHRAPVMVRVNTRKTPVQNAIDILARDGIVARPSPAASTALVITDGARRIATSSAYLDGLVELQDGSSQAAMAMLDIPAGARVLDYCAGGGGKVLALAARAEAKWYAHDALPQRMKDLPARAERAGAEVEILGADAVRDQQFDVVLCDVPCSGSGTWRRAPDAKWRLTTAGLTDLNRTQDQILDRAAQLVTAQGCLIYATCSVLRDENEDRIASFIARTQGWQLREDRRWPVSDCGDGFYLAHLKRE